MGGRKERGEKRGRRRRMRKRGRKGKEGIGVGGR